MQRAVSYKFFLIILLLNTNLVTGQYSTQTKLTFNNYSTLNHNLSTNYFYRVFQDKQGFLWFASDNGLFKFDGVSFSLVAETEGMDIVSWYIENKQKIWLFDYSGNISVFDMFTKKLIKYGNVSTNKVEWKKVRPFVLGSKFNDTLYFTKLYDVETIIFNNQDQHTHRFTEFDNFRNKIFDKFKVEEAFESAPTYLYPNANFMLPEGDSSLIFDGSIYEINKNGSVSRIFNGATHNNIKDITHYVKKDKDLYLSIWNQGLIKISNYFSNGLPKQIDTLLKHDRVSCFLFDNFNQLWITTATDGIFKYNTVLYNLKKINYPQLNIVNDEISSLLSIEDHILFFVKNSSTIVVYDTVSKKVYYQNIPTLKHSEFNTIGKVNDEYYAIFQSGVYKVILKNHKIELHELKYFPKATFIAKDAVFYNDFINVNNRLEIFKIDVINNSLNGKLFENKNLSSAVYIGNDSFLYGTSIGLLLNDKKIPILQNLNVKKIIKIKEHFYIISQQGLFKLSLENNHWVSIKMSNENYHKIV